MIDWQRLLEIFLSGGLATALVLALKSRADYHTKLREIALAEEQQKREIALAEGQQKVSAEKQEVEGQGTIASAAATIATGAANVVKLQAVEAEEMRLELRALQSEVVALRTALNQETEARMRAEAGYRLISDQMNDLRDAQATIKATLSTAQEERAKLSRENNGLKGALYDMALGVNGLVAQVKAKGEEPVYVLGVPFSTPNPQPRQRTGPLSTQDLRVPQPQ